MQRIIVTLSVLLVGCFSNNNQPDAYGNFEATEVSVSAEQTGKIVRLNIEEGQTLEQGEVVGLIDTVHLHHKKQQLLAQRDVIRANYPNVSSQIKVLRKQKKNLQQEIERFTKLAEKGAVPQKRVDDLTNQVAVLQSRIESVKSQNQPVAEKLKLNRVRIEEVEEKMKDAVITAPVEGTVLTKLSEEGEMAQAGMPLFRLADLKKLTLRAYVKGTQLDDFSIGQEVTVRTDKDKDTYHKHSGTITWVANEAEFTPTTIQTKEERTDLVYAIKIKVPNLDGSLKIGMPGEVLFDTQSIAQQ